MATLTQTTDWAAPETWALVKHELGYLDIRTGEIIESLDGFTMPYVLLDSHTTVWRGEEFEGTYYQFENGQYVEYQPLLPVNVLCGFEAGMKFDLDTDDYDKQWLCSCGNPSGVTTTCMETGDAVCDDCGNFIKAE